jgi:hypothetical protein
MLESLVIDIDGQRDGLREVKSYTFVSQGMNERGRRAAVCCKL